MITLSNLIDALNSSNSAIQHEALINTGLLLEMHSSSPSTLDSYEHLIANKYFHLRLNGADQSKLIKTIGNLLLTRSATSSLLWAIGRGYSSLEPLPFLLTWLVLYSNVADEDSIRQGLLSIDAFMWCDDENFLLPEVQAFIDEIKPFSRLQALTNHNSEQVRSLATKLLNCLQS